MIASRRYHASGRSESSLGADVWQLAKVRLRRSQTAAAAGYASGVRLLLPILLICGEAGCGNRQPDWCRDRADDADCDGVPDSSDRCVETPDGASTDRVGCSQNQAAGCAVEAIEPKTREKLEGDARFRWSGDCDVYLLQLSDDPAFPAGATRTALRTEASEVSASGDETWWRVVGGLDGASAGYSTPAREIRWR